jgi:hypothetical protein
VNDFSDLFLVPEYIPFEPPPTHTYYKTVDQAIIAINKWAEPRGYVCVKGRTKKRAGGEGVYKVWVRCEQSRKFTKSKADKDKVRPNIGSKKRECTF